MHGGVGGAACAVVLQGHAGLGRTVGCGPGGLGSEAQASPRQLGTGGVQDCWDQLQIRQAGVKCLRCFSPPLPSLPALLKINNCVNSRGIVLGPQPLGLPGPGRCWQGLPEPHAGSRLGLAARPVG